MQIRFQPNFTYEMWSFDLIRDSNARRTGQCVAGARSKDARKDAHIPGRSGPFMKYPGQDKGSREMPAKLAGKDQITRRTSALEQIGDVRYFTTAMTRIGKAVIFPELYKFGWNVWKFMRRESIRLARPVFVIGCPRSGTSILVRLLGTHPDMANWSEAGEVWDPDHYRDADASHCWTADMVTEDAASRLHATFECYRRITRKRRFVNKHPRNTVRVGYLNKIFPDCFFIHIIRDGRAVVNSIINAMNKEIFRQKIPFGNFCKPPDWRNFLRENIVEQTALQWREIVRSVLEKREKLEPRYFELRYEDLCSNPRDSIASLFSFAELKLSQEAIAKIPKKLKNMNYKYKSDLTPSQLTIISAIQKDLLIELGYCQK